MKRKRIVVGFLVAALAILVLYYLNSAGTAPAGQPALVRLNSSNIVSLKDAFNGAGNSVRVLVMLSPT